MCSFSTSVLLFGPYSCLSKDPCSASRFPHLSQQQQQPKDTKSAIPALTHRCRRSGFAPRSCASGGRPPEPSGAERWWRSRDEWLQPAEHDNTEVFYGASSCNTTQGNRLLKQTLSKDSLDWWLNYDDVFVTDAGLLCFGNSFYLPASIIKTPLRRCPNL